MYGLIHGQLRETDHPGGIVLPVPGHCFLQALYAAQYELRLLLSGLVNDSHSLAVDTLHVSFRRQLPDGPADGIP